jgi:hypothetical protein
MIVVSEIADVASSLLDLDHDVDVSMDPIDMIAHRSPHRSVIIPFSRASPVFFTAHGAVPTPLPPIQVIPGCDNVLGRSLLTHERSGTR